MMNAKHQPTYGQALASLQEENIRLKQENNRLTSQLAAYEKVSNDQSQPISIIDYYLRKYLEYHDTILEQRLNPLYQSQIDLQKQYDAMACQEKKVDVLIKQNQQLLEQLQQKENELLLQQQDVERQTAFYQTSLQEDTQKRNDLYQYTTEYYNNIIERLESGQSRSNVLDYVDFVLATLLNQLYTMNVEAREHIEKTLQEERTLNRAIHLFDATQKAYWQEKNSVAPQLTAFAYEEVEGILEQYDSQMAQKKQAIEEIDRLFKDTKERHMRSIVDEIRHFQVLEFSNHDIALAMDKTLEEYQERLLQLDTKTNIVMQKNAKLQTLLLQKANLDQIKVEFERAAEEYENLQMIYQEVNQNIDEVQQYISSASRLFENTPLYQTFVMQYEQYQAEQTLVKADEVALQHKLTKLKTARSDKILNPYARAEILLIDQEIAATLQAMEQTKDRGRTVQDNIYQAENSKENSALIQIIHEKASCEQRLPKLFQKQRAFMLLIDEKYQWVQELKKSLNGYQTICEQVEALERELND